MKNLKTISAVAAILFALTSQSVMALEVINSENDYDPALQNGWVDEAQLPVASYRSHAEHALKFSGGSENDTGLTSTFTDTDHHASSNSSDPLSIDYMGQQ